MPASPHAFKLISEKIQSVDGDRFKQDYWLDVWLEYRDMATEWDADHWKLPTLQMLQELKMMNKTPLDDERLHW